MEDYQFQIGDVTWGVDCPVFVEADGFDPANLSWDTTGKATPRQGARRFGRDLPVAGVWAWTMYVDKTKAGEALDVLAGMTTLWRAESIRRTPSEVVELRYQLAGRERLIYGRPNNFAAPPDNRLMNGLVPITADFLCADTLTYGIDEQSVTLDVVQPSVGGLRAPLRAPLSSDSTDAPRQGSIFIEGDAATWVVVEFNGPQAQQATKYRLDVDNGSAEVGYDGLLAKDQTVTVDPRPWVSAATRWDGGSAAGKLSLGTRMHLLQLEPGPHSFSFSASDPSGSATCTVRWREASPSI